MLSVGARVRNKYTGEAGTVIRVSKYEDNPYEILVREDSGLNLGNFKRNHLVPLDSQKPFPSRKVHRIPKSIGYSPTLSLEQTKCGNCSLWSGECMGGFGTNSLGKTRTSEDWGCLGIYQNYRECIK